MRPARLADAPPLAATVLLAVLLLTGALYNRFPLIFPDSGAYLSVALGHDYAIDRSSIYGFLLKPLMPGHGVAGLWLAAAAQALVVAGIIMFAARIVLERTGEPARLPWLAIGLLALLTSLPWQAAQFMPDALTGPLVLLAWIAARRDWRQNGTPSLWIAAILLAMTHYTHVVLLGVTSFAVIATDALMGAPRPAVLRRAAAAAIATFAAVALLTAGNGAALGRWKMAPLGSVFLFARVNQDGLVPRWLNDHCGRDAPAPLCAERGNVPANSQTLLWHAPQGIVSRHIWDAPNEAERWSWAEMMGIAARGSILDHPLLFAEGAIGGTVRQFAAFHAIDDECPCSSTTSSIGYALVRYRPATVASFLASRQGSTGLPVVMIRSVTTPIAAIALLLLPVVLVIAVRRRDATMATLIAGVFVALIVNAALTGALSDVHDRYQARLVWLAPLLVLLAAYRWWRGRTRAF